MEYVFPAQQWDRRAPEELGLDNAKLDAAREWMLTSPPDTRPTSAAIVRGGYLLADWYHKIEPTAANQRMASVCKSIYCSMLGIAIAEGKIPSADARLVDYYPAIRELMDPAACPQPETALTVEDVEQITFGMLAAQVSGFLRPNQSPGKAWHYQTHGMGVIMHAVAMAYGYYDPHDVAGSIGSGELIRAKLRDPIGGTWRWKYGGFPHPPTAKPWIFDNYTSLYMTTLDMARMGLLWLAGGRWGGRQIIPAAWQQEASRVSDRVKAAAAPEDWKYGLGLWCNSEGRLWPDLPRDAYCAAGFNAKMIWVCPSLDLVVTQNSGRYDNMSVQQESSGLLSRVVDAIRS